MRGVRTARCVRHHGTRRVDGEGEGVAGACAGDSGPDTRGAGHDHLGNLLLDLSDLHALLRPESRRGAGGLRAHGRLEEGRDCPVRPLLIQTYALRPRLLLDQRDLSDTVRCSTQAHHRCTLSLPHHTQTNKIYL